MSSLFGSTTIKGNRITDFAQTTATVGIPIPFGYGAFPVDGNIIWAPLPPKESRTVRRQGKGGVKQETFTYTLSYAVAFCQGPIYGYKWIKRAGKIVYSTDPATPVEDAAYAAKWADKVEFYFGTRSQLPDSTIESYEGTGQVSAFRNLAYIVVEDDNVTENGGAISPYEACVIASPPEFYVTSEPYPLTNSEAASVTLAATGGELRTLLFERLSQEAAEFSLRAITGELRDVNLRRQYREAATVQLAATGGILKEGLIVRGTSDEAMSATLSATDGELRAVLISRNTSDEAALFTLTPTGGTLA